MQIKSGDYVLLISPDEKTFLIKVKEGQQFGTHMGTIAHSELIGRTYGEVVNTHLGKPLALMDPTLADRIMKLRRRTQIIYPKDAGMIAIKTGLRSGMRVIECGTGSGALTLILASMVAPEGRVYTYERREEFMEDAIRNVGEAGLDGFVEFKLREVSEGFDEEGVDVVVLDLPSPWEGVPAASRAMRGGGRLASLSPTFNQVERTVACLREAGFLYIETLELLARHILARPHKTRPVDRMVAHTGFLTFARKAIIRGNETTND